MWGMDRQTDSTHNVKNHQLLHTEIFTQRSLYTQKLLKRAIFTQTLLHRAAFTHRETNLKPCLKPVWTQPETSWNWNQSESVSETSLKQSDWNRLWKNSETHLKPVWNQSEIETCLKPVWNRVWNQSPTVTCLQKPCLKPFWNSLKPPETKTNLKPVSNLFEKVWNQPETSLKPVWNQSKTRWRRL